MARFKKKKKKKAKALVPFQPRVIKHTFECLSHSSTPSPGTSRFPLLAGGNVLEELVPELLLAAPGSGLAARGGTAPACLAGAGEAEGPPSAPICLQADLLAVALKLERRQSRKPCFPRPPRPAQAAGTRIYNSVSFARQA